MMPNRIIVAAGLALCAFSAAAQDRYPARQVEVVVPYAPGGAADIIARPLAQQLTRFLGEPFIIANKAGASGAIGTRQVASAAADGHTLGVVVVQVSILPVVDDLFGRARQYSVEQLTGIARLTADPVVIMANANTGWNSLKDMVAAAKQQPGKIEFASGGVYAGNHLPMELMAQKTGIQLLNVPYKGGGPSMAALLGGEVKLTSQVPSVSAPHIASGRVRPVGQTGAKRLALMPDIPTLKEQGADVEFYLWAGMIAPAGTPQSIIDTLDSTVTKAMNDPEFMAMTQKSKIVTAHMGAREFNRWWADDARKLADVVKQLGPIQ